MRGRDRGGHLVFRSVRDLIRKRDGVVVMGGYYSGMFVVGGYCSGMYRYVYKL